MPQSDRYIGVKYAFLGESPEEGFDCASVVFHYLRDLGYAVPLPWRLFAAGCSPAQAMVRARRWVEVNGTRLEGVRPTVGALIAFCWPGDKEPGHLGAIVDSDRFLNIYCGATGHLETLGPAWLKLVHSYWRLPWAQS